ncbi:transcriptional regulator family: Fungal Specific TF [Paecilomyces variotii]|nr:transcriptional regulator family: Fungal Specific TF [Paecilomyces variotii]
MASAADPSIPPNNGGHPNNNSNGLYSESSKSLSPQPHHRRGYQACDPCRKRKVKCDLGSVDNPRPPPCVRCRRESKRCEFSATRRKRKASEGGSDEVDGPLRRDKRMMVGESYNDTPGNGNASPYTQAGSTSFENGRASSRPSWSESSPSATTQIGRPAPTTQYATNSSAPSPQFQDIRLPRPPAYPLNGRGQSYTLESGQHMMNRTAAELLSPTISNSHDALHLLSEAAGRTEDLNRQSLENRYAARQAAAASYTSPVSPMAQTGTPRSGPQPYSTLPRPEALGRYCRGQASGPAEPHLVDNRAQSANSVDTQDPGYLDAVKAWSRLRFVRAGWLTVDEAMAYVAYYYEHMAPLSPIVLPDFSPPSTHRTLLTEEPVLAVTILTAASRHMKPKGDGAFTRAFYIHDRLWSYLRGMIERLFWGQEKFGGNSVGFSKPRSVDLGPLPGKVNLKGHLRSLGTVEALLLLTDWHPRNLHFPPGDDENTLLDMDAHVSLTRSDKDIDNDADQTSNKNSSGGAEGRLAFQKWLEPAWRSDRMSWMLLSTAQALAFELGVFDQKNSSNSNESPAEQMRKRRVRRLILVYVTQSSGRLGIPSMLPLPQWSHDIEPSLGDPKSGDVLIDRMQDCWIRISKVMYMSNQLLFASKEQTSELIRSGRYREQIDEFLPSLREFRRNLDSINLCPQMRHILTIEYEYTRLYVNCLALQAVVDRWTTMSNEAASAQAQSERPGSGPSPSGTASLRVLMELYRVNEPYIQEVVDASRKILQTVLEGLVPGDHLKHCPVRTYFRILSGMIFILKTFTLGATEDDVRVSLELQDKTVEALRTCVVDDVHLSHTIARLLELLTTNIRTRFLRFAPMDRSGEGEAQDRGSAPVSTPQSPRPRDSTQARRDVAGSQWQSSHSGAQNLGYSVDGSNNATPTVTNGHDPLANIPAQPINSSNLNVSFMPPPPSVYYNYYDPNATPPSAGLEDSNPPSQAINEGATSSGALPDWFALPLDQFFNSSTAGVDQGLGGTGPMVGEFDMLEVLLNEQYDKSAEGVDTAGGNGLPSQFL